MSVALKFNSFSVLAPGVWLVVWVQWVSVYFGSLTSGTLKIFGEVHSLGSRVSKDTILIQFTLVYDLIPKVAWSLNIGCMHCGLVTGSDYAAAAD